MKRYALSLRYALEGVWHAFTTERNFRLFAGLYALSLVLSWMWDVSIRDWQIVIFTGGIFLAVELVNTAVEHFSDAFVAHAKRENDHHTAAIKATKDIAAAASLVCAIAWGAILLIIFWPHIPWQILMGR